MSAPDCDREIFQKGEPVALLDARSVHAEAWVKELGKRTSARVDWHYSGGVAQVLHLGDKASRARVIAAIAEMPNGEDVRIMRVMEPEGAAGLYRAGVTETPKGVMAGFMGLDGEQVFIVEGKPRRNGSR